mmetsp:Transcript_14070/g.20595  ORF Transcript_14070/g.20595 Transcript_14070/m.20595 type:complete len:242 (-) Transcript_14070:244-969(-)|eukprot:CAMPEP_0194047986 /NCGR_PEP_ID=MMETSP0009_2-20130614/26460_1 /TAXON_ID=210454 /ORGANISM="Grammatophora oceanica, Strain CCMP 410" /LENGTH=241 /DNA_ID=CAMNT_0038693761 /DNA_START=238 /DNA_END=963 /DNA_ORIENTATION=-
MTSRNKLSKRSQEDKLRVDHKFFDEFYQNITLNAKSIEADNMAVSEPEELWTSGSETDGVESDMTSSCYDSEDTGSSSFSDYESTSGDEEIFGLEDGPTVDADRVAVAKFLRACRPTMVQPQLKTRTSGGYDVRSLDLVKNIGSDKASDVHMHVVCSNKSVTTNLVTPRGRVVSRRKLLSPNPIRRNSGKKKRNKRRMPKMSDKGGDYSVARSSTWDTEAGDTSTRSLYAFASSCSCNALP